MSEHSQAPASTGDRLIGAIMRNPEGLLLLAAGAALLMRKSATAFAASGPGQRLAASPPVDALKTAASGAKNYASEMAERTRDAAGTVASSASDYAGQARRAIGSQSERIARNTQSTIQETVERIAQDQPLMIAIAGLAAGAAVAAAFPATNFEKEALGPVGEQVSEAASRVGGQLKDAALSASDTLRNAAKDRGLNTEGLKDVATEVAQAFTSSMTGEAAPPSREPGRGR